MCQGKIKSEFYNCLAMIFYTLRLKVVMIAYLGPFQHILRQSEFVSEVSCGITQPEKRQV